MRRRIASFMVFMMLWSGLAATAGITFAHDDPELGLHADVVETTDGKAVFRAGNLIDLRVVFNEDVACEGTPHIIMKQDDSDDLLYIPYAHDVWKPGEGANVKYFQYIVNGHEPDGVYYLYDFGSKYPSGPEGNCNVDQIRSFNPGAMGPDSRNFYRERLPQGITIDNTAPQFVSVVLDSPSRYVFKAGDVIPFKVEFTEPLANPENLVLALNNGGEAVYKSMAGSTVLLEYIVQPGQDTSDLDIANVLGTLTDEAGNPAQIPPNVQLPDIDPWIVDTQKPNIAVEQQSGSGYAREHNLKLVVDNEDDQTLEVRYLWNQSDTAPDPSAITGTGANVGQPLPNPGEVNGDYYVHIYAKDAAGNEETGTFGPYKFDHEPPAVTFQPNSGRDNKEISVEVTVSDTRSGVKKFTYQWLGVPGGPEEVNGPSGVVTTPLAEGSLVLEVTAEDNAGNTKTYQSGSYVIDLTAPTIEFSKDGDATPAAMHQTNVRVTGQAGESGSVYVQWTSTVDRPDPADTGWHPIHSGPLPMDWKTVTTTEGLDGTWYLHVKAVDDAGNARFGFTPDGFVLDNTEPTVDFSPNGNNVYVQSEEVQLLIDGNASFTGYDVRYRISTDPAPSGGGDDWKATSDGLVKLENLSGVYYIHVRAIDPAGNAATVSSKAFRLDVEPPSGSVVLPGEYTNVREMDAELQATDGSGEPLDFQYRVNGGSWSDWFAYTPTLGITLDDQEGTQKVEVRYRDQAHNLSPVYEADIIYDITPPTYEFHSYSPDSWTKDQVTVTLFYSDNLAPDGSVARTFQENGEYTITFEDPAGNKNQVTVHVTNIDKERPAIKFTPNGVLEPRQTAHAEITVSDNVSSPDNIQVEWAWSMSQDTAPAAWNLLTATGIEPLANVDGQWYLWVRAVDEAGNIAEEHSQPFLLDNTKPTATVSYSTMTRTAMPVKASIVLSEPATVIKPADGSLEYTFTENGTFTFEFVDMAGNHGTAHAEVTWIDHSLPSAHVTLTPNGWTKDDIIVHVSVPGNPPRALAGFAVSGHAELIQSQPAVDGPEGSLVEAAYRFTSNGTLGFTIIDLQTGIENYETIVVDKIDRTPPTAKLLYSHTSWTQDDVTVRLIDMSDDKSSVTVLSDEVYTFTDNGNYTFRFRDEAGNISEITAVVDWIDRTPPQPIVTYSPDSWTQDSVTASVYFIDQSPVYILNHDGPDYIFHENDSFTLYYEDAAGNQGQVELKVDWIDRTPPSATLHYSTREWTKDDVTVTLNGWDNSGAPLVFVAGGSEGGGVHKFTENGSYTFIVEDQAGNRSSYTAIVDRIDRTPPEADVFYSVTVPTNASVRAVIVPSEPVTVQNADGLTHDFTDNGQMTFEIVDRAGNVTFVTAKVDWIDRTPPVPYIEYSTTMPTYEDVTATVKANEPFLVLNNNRSSQHVFRENGSFVFYIQDLAGNVAEIEAKAANIDKNAATITLEYSETNPTRNDVTVTVQADRPLTFSGEAGPTVTFTKNGVVTLSATDDLGRSYWIPIEVSNIDRTPPEIRFTEGERLVAAQGAAFHPLADVQAFDLTDGDLTDRIEAVHAVDTSVPGKYEVTYRVRDAAGNDTTVVRTVEVIGPGSLKVFANQQLADGEGLTLRAPHVKLQWFGTEGEVHVRWAYGRLQLGEFKLIDQAMPEDGLAIDRQGYYTFLIEDQERRYQLIHIYVIPSR